MKRISVLLLGMVVVVALLSSCTAATPANNGTSTTTIPAPGTTIKHTLGPMSPRPPLPLTAYPGAAGIATDYILKTYNIHKTDLLLVGTEPLILDNVTNEVITVMKFLTLGQAQNQLVPSIVVDSRGQAFPLDQAYYNAIAARYKDAAGSMNLDLYVYLQNKSDGDLVRVEIVVDLSSDLASFITSRGFKVTRVGDTRETRFIYAELSKEFIVELAFSAQAPYMQLEALYTYA